jgi:hypothetical protein
MLTEVDEMLQDEAEARTRNAVDDCELRKAEIPPIRLNNAMGNFISIQTERILFSVSEIKQLCNCLTMGAMER